MIDNEKRTTSPDDRPDRPKAEFRALRELAGFNWEEMGAALGAQPRAIKRWEDTREWNTAPKDAWDLLDDTVADCMETVMFAAQKAEELAESIDGELGEVVLPYWSSRREYSEFGLNSGDGVDWKRANASSRALFWILSFLGYKVRFVPGSENIVTKYQNRH